MRQQNEPWSRNLSPHRFYFNLSDVVVSIVFILWSSVFMFDIRSTKLVMSLRILILFFRLFMRIVMLEEISVLIVDCLLSCVCLSRSKNNFPTHIQVIKGRKCNKIISWGRPQVVISWQIWGVPHPTARGRTSTILALWPRKIPFACYISILLVDERDWMLQDITE